MHATFTARRAGVLGACLAAATLLTGCVTNTEDGTPDGWEPIVPEEVPEIAALVPEQVAADGNLAGQTYPDQSLYPANSVPAVVRRINNALLRAGQIEFAETGTTSRDWQAPIVADAEAVREELGLDQWDVLGQSFGGFCLLHYLAVRPERVGRALFTGGVPSISNS